MGYEVVVKPGKARKNIVTQRLNALRDTPFTDSGNRRSERYVAGKSLTKSGKLRQA
jgi:hypothetical protein